MDHHHYNAHLAAPEPARVNPADLAPLGAPGAAAAGMSAPHKDEAHRLAGAAGYRDQGKTDNPDCADYLAGDQPGARPHQRRDRLASGRTSQDPRRDTVMTGRVSNAPDGAGVSAPVSAVETFADRVGAPQ